MLQTACLVHADLHMHIVWYLQRTFDPSLWKYCIHHLSAKAVVCLRPSKYELGCYIFR